jgi:hypothetical protein
MKKRGNEVECWQQTHPIEFIAHYEYLYRYGDGKGSVLRDGADGDGAREHEQAQLGANCYDELDGIDGRLGIPVDLLQPAAAGQGAIAGVGVDDS